MAPSTKLNRASLTESLRSQQMVIARHQLPVPMPGARRYGATC
jgi:hypothetical protein